MPAPVVFISYSHKDEAWKDKLLPHLNALVQAGVAMEVWHDRRIDGGDKWYPEITDAMDKAAAAILLISADFLASRFCVQEEVPALIRRREEAGMLLIPVLVRKCRWKAHRWLSSLQMLPRDGKCVAIDFAGDLADDVFDTVAEQVLGRFQTLATESAAKVVVSISVQQLAALSRATPNADIVPPKSVVPWPALAPEHIDLTHLPQTGKELFGRDEELALMDQAWSSSDQTAPPARILAFSAHGGVGKSTLVNRWLVEMARDRYRGATRVFGWSFYSQGVRGETAASADAFIDAALRFFGDTSPATGSPWDKGTRLAHLVGRERALLILDGMEPLQSGHAFDRGKLRDPALEALLRRLTRHSSGLCLITTRELLPDLNGHPGVITRDLEQIGPEAGRALLHTARVIGTDTQLEELARRFGPHALAISLLGVYLREHPGHGIRPAGALEQMPGAKPIERVLNGFDQWLGKSPESDALRLLGCFDRPAAPECLRALRNPPTIIGLTDRLAGLDDAGWNRTLARLEKLRLVQLRTNSSGQHAVDAHPLIREHFASLLKGTEVWRAAHRRLFDHLCASTKESYQPTLDELQPLYQAVAHGCEAGLQQQACDDVYFARIRHRNEGYSMKRLGAIGSDLAAVTCFFELPWRRVLPTFGEADKAWLLNEAAFRLRALGRLTEALDPLRAGLETSLKANDFKESAIRADNLTELQLILGDVSGAERDAAQSVTYADLSGDNFLQIVSRTVRADAMHYSGLWTEADKLFREAEQMQGSWLFSVRGFKYCDMLLASSERAAWQVMLSSTPFATTLSTSTSRRAVTERAARALDIVQSGSRGLLDIALNHLTLSRAALHTAVLEDTPRTICVPPLESAMSGLRSAGRQDYLPRSLLTRSWLRSLEGAHSGPNSAQEDLDEAWEIAERGSMKLFMADTLLHRARLFFREKTYPWPDTSAKADLAGARQLIEQCGYWRRKEELEDAEQVIGRAN